MSWMVFVGSRPRESCRQVFPGAMTPAVFYPLPLTKARRPRCLPKLQTGAIPARVKFELMMGAVTASASVPDNRHTRIVNCLEQTHIAGTLADTLPVCLRPSSAAAPHERRTFGAKPGTIASKTSVIASDRRKTELRRRLYRRIVAPMMLFEKINESRTRFVPSTFAACSAT